jgi:hypothetical protein
MVLKRQERSSLKYHFLFYFKVVENGCASSWSVLTVLGFKSVCPAFVARANAFDFGIA